AADSMTSRSRHATKLREDVSARLAVLTELPDAWTPLATHLMTAAPVPDAPFGYLLWQTFAGAGFVDRARMHAYIEKAMREAATHTRWVTPDAGYETAVHALVDRAYDDPSVREPLAAFVDRI